MSAVRRRHMKPISPSIDINGLGPGAVFNAPGRFSSSAQVDLGSLQPTGLIVSLSYDAPASFPPVTLGICIARNTRFDGVLNVLEDAIDPAGETLQLAGNRNALQGILTRGLLGVMPATTASGMKKATFITYGSVSRRFAVVVVYASSVGPALGSAAGQGVTIIPFLDEVVPG